MYVGMRMGFTGRGNEKCRTRNENDKEWWQNMRMDCAGREEWERQNREWE
jgi:hypothetical protein